jgi:hypothetical protein
MSAQVDHLSHQETNEDNCIDLLSLEAIAPDAEMDQHTTHPLLAMVASNDPNTLYYCEVYRHKSRLNIGGHKQMEGIDYDT